MASSGQLRAVLLTLLLGVTCFAPTAAAREADANIRMAARELAMAGAEAFEKQDYVTALDRFERAEALYKVPSITVMTARCFARVGRLVEAVDKYEETRRMPLDATAPEAFQRAVADAATELEAVRARVARLELVLPADAPPETNVTLDGRAVPRALWGVATPVDPGAHHLLVRAPGRRLYSSSLSLAEGSHEAIEISLTASSPMETGGEARPPLDDASPRGRGPSTLGIALLASGGVALAVGAATGIAALGHQASLDEQCKPGCPASSSSDLHAFRVERAVSYVGFGLGLAAVGAGTYVWLHRGSAGGQVGALVWPGGAALRGSF